MRGTDRLAQTSVSGAAAVRVGAAAEKSVKSAAKSKTPAQKTKAGGRYKLKSKVKSGRSKQRPYRIKTSVKSKGCPVR